jgi:hypothetical protein
MFPRTGTSTAYQTGTPRIQPSMESPQKTASKNMNTKIIAVIVFCILSWWFRDIIRNDVLKYGPSPMQEIAYNAFE